MVTESEKEVSFVVASVPELFNTDESFDYAVEIRKN